MSEVIGRKDGDNENMRLYKSKIFLEVGRVTVQRSPIKKRPISGNQQIQFGTKHNFHGLKSVT